MGFGARKGIIAADKYIARGATFDGTNDYLTHASSLLTDSSQILLSFWFRINTLKQQWFYNVQDSGAGGNKNRLQVSFDGASGPVKISGRNSSGTELLDVRSSSISDNNWHHCAFSCDLTNASKRHLYIDGSSDLATVNIYTSGTMELSGGTSPENHIGSQSGAASKLDGDLADFFVESATYLDLSDSANLAKLIGSGDRPVFLGDSGDRVTGSSPDIFLSGPVASWHTNKGSGSGFTENGTLTAASSSPSD